MENTVRLKKIPHKKELFSAVFLSYKTWMKSQGFEFIKTEPVLKKELKERGFDMSRSNNLYYLKGYLLISDPKIPVAASIF